MVISLWCLRYFLQKDSCMVLPFLIQNKVLNMIFQHLECFRQRDTEPLFKIGFPVALWVLKFYEMRNCPPRQKSYIKLVSALVVRTHAWMGSWPLRHPTFLKRLFMFLQEDYVINYYFPMINYFTGSSWPFSTSDCIHEGVDKVYKICFEELKNQ